MYEPLTKSCKGLFPFKVATTSYIYPDRILPNARMLAPFLDELELVLFESAGENNLPSERDIEGLVSLTKETGLTYNVHLPIDISLGDESPTVREEGVSTVTQIIGLTGPLDPSTYTIHFTSASTDRGGNRAANAWRSRICQSMEKILGSGIAPRSISVETLDYPFELVEDIIKSLGLSVCLDLGHLFLYGRSMSDYALRYLEKARIVHVHGVRHGKDHLPLDMLDDDTLRTMEGILRHFAGPVSIEVFSFQDLSRSLKVLEGWYKED